jgi:hypothetical protein
MVAFKFSKFDSLLPIAGRAGMIGSSKKSKRLNLPTNTLLIDGFGSH